MNDLSPEARTLVDICRSPGVLTRTDRDRIKRGVLLRVATVGTATASTGTAAAMSLASKITLMAVAATVVGGGASALWALRAPTAVPRVLAGDSSPSTHPVPAVPAPAAMPNAVVPHPPALSADPGRPDRAKKTIKRPAAVPAIPSASSAAAPLAFELKVLRQAQEDLRAGLPENAYQRLADFDRHHGSGVLAQERHALSAIALCQWRPGNEARIRAQEFLRDTPESPLANRVRLACEKPNSVAE
jgi:hypothetical protein